MEGQALGPVNTLHCACALGSPSPPAWGTYWLGMDCCLGYLVGIFLVPQSKAA